MNFVISGQVVEKESETGVPDLRIEAWDRDLLFDDWLGQVLTDAEGKFQLSFTEDAFQELFEARPDVYLKVFAPNDDLLHVTEQAVRYRPGRQEQFDIRLARDVLGDYAPKGDNEMNGNELTIEAINEARPDPELQRRILTFLNGANRVEEITGIEDLNLKPEIAHRILDNRRNLGAYGYRDLKQLIGIKGFDIRRFKDLIFRFGPAFFGEFSRPYATEDPDTGATYHVAHAALLHTGQVLFLPESNTKATLLWDPSDEVNPQFESATNEPDDYLFCSGHSFLSDGKLLVAGGGGGGPSNVNRAWKFDPVAKNWTKTAGDMTYARWYPTVVTLGDERRILVVSGAPNPGRSTTEVYDEFTDSFTLLAGPDSQRDFSQLYPGLHALPDGEVFYTRTGFGGPGPGPGGADPLPGNPFFRYIAPSTGEWTEIENEIEYPDRVRGMSVLLLDPCYPSVRVMIIGGTGMPGAETAEIINLSKMNPSWEHATLIPGGTSRTNVNAVLLPDGTVFVVGGTTAPDSSCVLYNPASGTWSTLAKTQYRKQYHSVSILLPSGKVMATGGSNYGGGSNVIEIFSPPYLFKGARPVIDAYPGMVHHASQFDLETPDAADIEKVVLVRPMAVTHQTDTEQRVIQMKFTRSGTTLKVKAPNGHHPHTAPRGYYLLFILNGKGVPSEGKFIFLH
jgi:hypothetical protein